MSGTPANLAIWLSNVRANRAMQLGIADFRNLRIEKNLQGVEKLSFEIKSDNPKIDYILEDQNLQLDPDDGDRWIVDHFEDLRPGYRTVVCFAYWTKLGWRTRYGLTSILAKTPLQGLTQILNSTGWTVGSVPTNIELYTMEEMDGTILSLIRRWAAVTGYEVVFDSVNLEVSFVTSIGNNQGISLIYGHNLKEIKRTYKGPEATRLYPIGANNLTIESANPSGVPYIENYDYYTDQGLTLIEARNLYRKDLIWVDTKYLSSVNLYDSGVARLEALSQPRISYEGRIIDVSRLMSTTGEVLFEVGDTCRVEDGLIGIDTTARVKRLVRFPLDPQLDEVELGFVSNGTVDVSSGETRDVNYDALVPVVYANTEAITLNASEKNFGSISVTSAGDAAVIAGSTIIGVASGTGTVRFRLVIDGIDIGEPRDIAFTAGQQVEYSWPSFAESLDEGSHEIHWRGQIVSGTGTIDVAEGDARSWVILRGAVGVGINTSPNAFVSEEILGYVATLTHLETIWIEDPVGEIVLKGETLTAHEAAITELYIIPFTIGDPTFGVIGGPGQLT